MGQKKHKTLDQSVDSLIEKAKESSSLSIGEILEILSGRGRFLVLVFLSLPFCQPIQIPGMSILFGLIVAFIGLRMALGGRVYFPKRLLVKRISSRKIEKMFKKFSKIMHFLRKWIHPRMNRFFTFKGQKIMNGVFIGFLGLLLALPLPIPLTNLAAGWAILLLSLGILEDDGLLLLFGYLISFLTVLFFIFLIFYLKEIFVFAF